MSHPISTFFNPAETASSPRHRLPSVADRKMPLHRCKTAVMTTADPAEFRQRLQHGGRGPARWRSPAADSRWYPPFADQNTSPHGTEMVCTSARQRRAISHSRSPKRPKTGTSSNLCHQGAELPKLASLRDAKARGATIRKSICYWF